MWMDQMLRHLELSAVALLVTLLIGVPGGAILARHPRYAFIALSTANLGRTIPSLAILALAYPIVGTGFAPAVIALIALGVPPVLVASYTGIKEVDQEIVDAARGMGLTDRQRLFQLELPVAAPIMVSGIRTSATQIVASATLASLIGGGGLGEMILAGLTNMRYDLLIAGSILVGVLALATEGMFILFERKGLPAGIRFLQERSTSGYRAGSALNARHWQVVIAASAVGCVVVFGVSAAGRHAVAGLGGVASAHVDPSLPVVHIGSKDFTEQLVLGEIYAQALESRGYKVVRKLNLGATAVADAAVRSGQIDLYPEYTGTALTAVLKKTPDQGTTSDEVWKAVHDGYQARGLAVFSETPFSNGNAVVVTKKFADEHHLTTLSDLAKIASSTQFAAVPGFDTREDGLPLLKKAYGIEFAGVKTFEIGLKYKALVDGKVNAVYGFETDGQIAEYGLVVLKDDKQIWPPYHVAPIVSRDFAASAGPEFEHVLDNVTATLDADSMREMNRQVDHDKEEPSDVAHEFVQAHMAQLTADVSQTAQAGDDGSSMPSRSQTKASKPSQPAVTSS